MVTFGYVDNMKDMLVATPAGMSTLMILSAIFIYDFYGNYITFKIKSMFGKK